MTGIDRDQVFILLFFGVAGLASIASHCLIRKYFVASLVASFAASVFTSASVVAYILCSHLPPAKLSWLGMVSIPAFLYAIPLAFVTGLPFLILRQRASSERPDGDRRILKLPNARILGLSAGLCVLLLYGVSALYHQMQRETMDRALYAAVEHGTVADVQNVLNTGADVNSRTGYGTTPLMYASFYGRKDTVEFLLKKGANPRIVGPRGETALKWALQNKHSDVASLLRREGARE